MAQPGWPNRAACSDEPLARPAQDPQGPRFLSFALNSPRLLHGQPLTVTAVLTDPDGVDDIIGGSLLDPSSGAAYGAFQSAAQEGSYQITLAWAALDAVSPIDGTLAEPSRCTLRAEFFDSAGHSSTREVALELGCERPNDIACRTSCVGAYWRDNCGSCDNVCSYGDSFRDGVGSCGDNGAAYYGAGDGLTLTSCAQVPPAVFDQQPFNEQRCRCAFE